MINLESILKSVFNITESQLSDDSKLASFEEWDSMAHMLFITQLEEEYGIDLSGDEIASIKTIGDIKKILAIKGKLD